MNKIEKLIKNRYFFYITKIDSWKKISLLVAAIVGCYYISLKFIFPGYFDPLIPHHADFFYTYSGFSSALWGKIFMYPRPIGFSVLKIAGILGMKGVIFFLIVFNFINIFLTIIFVKKLGNLKIYWPLLLVYLFLLFSQPGFYFNYTYDFFDAVAYFFVILTMLIWLKIREKITPAHLVFLSILIALSFFSKETYIITLLIFFAWQFAFKESRLRKNTAIMFFVTAGIFIASLIHSRISQSVWVNFASNADNPYFTNFNPLSIWKSFCFYLDGWGNAGVLFIVAFSLLAVALNRKYLKEFLLLLFMGIAAYVPYSILPNHQRGYYFWLGIPLSYSVILLVNPNMINTFLIKVKNKKTNIIASTAFIAVFIISTAFSLKNNQTQKKNILWVPRIQLEQINRNVMSSFPILKNNIKDNDKILITGIDFAAHPFSCQNDIMDIYFNKKNDFIENYFGKNHSWTIFEYKKIIDKGCGLISYTNDNNLDLTGYDEIFIFRKDAKLMKVVNKDEVELLKNSKVGEAAYYEAILNPKLFK